MRRDYLSIIIVGCFFVLWLGCNKRMAAAEPVKPPTVSDANKTEPKIKLEKAVHDFGEVMPQTPQSCEFKFTNVGDGPLTVTRVQSCCGVTARLKGNKKSYAPGESGTVQVGFRSYNRPTVMNKDLFIHSNDKNNPSVKLTIKAKIVRKVTCEPSQLKLSLKAENGGCPKITLSSIDNQPFAVKGFKSTGNSITADVNASVKAAKIVLEPKVDIQKLRKSLDGQIEISLTHPQCNVVTMTFTTPPEFKTTPSAIVVFNAEPQKPTTRDVWILSNYDEDFEVESTSSKSGFIKVQSQEKVGNRLKLTVEITPPPIEGKRRFFTDVFSVNIKGGEKLEITCRGFYEKRALQGQSQRAAAPKRATRPPTHQ